VYFYLEAPLELLLVLVGLVPAELARQPIVVRRWPSLSTNRSNRACGRARVCSLSRTAGYGYPSVPWHPQCAGEKKRNGKKGRWNLGAVLRHTTSSPSHVRSPPPRMVVYQCESDNSGHKFILDTLSRERDADSAGWPFFVQELVSSRVEVSAYLRTT